MNCWKQRILDALCGKAGR